MLAFDNLCHFAKELARLCLGPRCLDWGELLVEGSGVVTG